MGWLVRIVGHGAIILGYSHALEKIKGNEGSWVRVATPGLGDDEAVFAAKCELFKC